MWDGSVHGSQMFEWKLLYGLPSDLKMTVKDFEANQAGENRSFIFSLCQTSSTLSF